ncbi:MAG: vitamin B12-dependent ribonucleotide reductase [Candidatus Amesbacteria bacterium]|nr:vitamin B12-dependent ribonucleotide reductase [Candidatus Amesbacteria bacterium]
MDIPTDITAPQWSTQAIKVLKERYFKKDKEGNILEDVNQMCWRVAREMASVEQDANKYAREYYRLMLNRWFLPNSPTLMNAGKNNGLQYSACYVLPVPDDIAGIFDGIKHQALIHQSGGGTGFSFSRLRAKGSRVGSTMGVASGPVSFMRIYNEATQQIKQGGMRRGANMGILRVDHPDILEFIHCKDDGTGITNFNISVTITNKFMEALSKDEDYELIAPNSKQVVGRLSAKKVWDEIAKGAWQTGDPGLVFIDRINESTSNPIRAEGWEVESTNPCGEQPLYPYDACNLGSIFLKYFIKDKQVDWDKLKETTHLAVRFLDSVIEKNPFPLPQIAETVRNIRRIGLGIGGWADMLVELEIPYDSQQALDLAEKIMKFINDEGHKASMQLAIERGPFPMWQQSIYKDTPIRNSTVTTIAPTGSIGILADNSGGCEPLFAIAYQHIVKIENRTLTFVNPKFEEVAHKRGFYSEGLMKKVSEHGVVRDIEEIPADVRAVFGTAHEINPDWHVKTQAAFQKYTDNGVSKTINLRHDSTVEDIKKAYMMAWDTGCMGITVFRDGCKNEQVLNLGIGKEPVPTIKPRPLKVEGATYRIETPMGIAFITVNQDPDGNPFEVFVTIGKAGSEVAAMAEALGRLISTTLRFGNHLPPRERARELMDQLMGIGGGRSVGFGPNKIKSLPDAVAKALGMHFGLIGFQPESENTHPAVQLTLDDKPTRRMDLCPKCGETALAFEEGCKKCYGCGYSEC